MKIDTFAQKGLICAAALLTASSTAQAAQITATTSGVDSGLDSILDELLPNVAPAVLGADNFFTISFLEGDADEFVDSIVFDLSADPDAVFDNQDFFFFSAAPEVGASTGISATDISFSAVTRADFSNPNPTQTLAISFAPGSFSVGDSFSFGVDTNGVGDDVVAEFASLSSLTNDAIETFNDTGSDFGNSAATFSVTLASGASRTVGFEDVGNYTSVASATISPAASSTSSASSTIQAEPLLTPTDRSRSRRRTMLPTDPLTSELTFVAELPSEQQSETAADLVSAIAPETTAVPEPATALSLLFVLGGMWSRKR